MVEPPGVAGPGANGGCPLGMVLGSSGSDDPSVSAIHGEATIRK